MNREELARRQRCRALRLAVVVGVLLPIFTRTLAAAVVAGLGIVAALAVYWRNCRQW